MRYLGIVAAIAVCLAADNLAQATPNYSHQAFNQTQFDNNVDIGVYLSNDGGATWTGYGYDGRGDATNTADTTNSSLYKAMQAALPGAIIEIRGGMQFDWNRDCGLNVNKSVTIRGDGSNPIFYFHDDYAYNGFKVNASDVTLQDFTFICDGSGTTRENFAQIGGGVSGLTVSGVSITGVQGLLAGGNWTTDLTFTGNTVTSAGYFVGMVGGTWDEWSDQGREWQWVSDVIIDGAPAVYGVSKGVYRGGYFDGDNVITGNLFSEVGAWATNMYYTAPGDTLKKNHWTEWCFPTLEIEKNLGTLLIDGNTFINACDQYAIRGDTILDSPVTLGTNIYDLGGDFYRPVNLDPLGGGVYAAGFMDQGDVSGAPIPEPVTMAGLVLGVGSLVGYVRRRRQQ